jgi:hypothetical protein
MVIQRIRDIQYAKSHFALQKISNWEEIAAYKELTSPFYVCRCKYKFEEALDIFPWKNIDSKH